MRKILCAALSLTMLASSLTAIPQAMAAEAKTPQYQTRARQMEKLSRGLIAVKTTSDGVYLSWRLLGDESLENQAFDIYRDGEKIHTTGAHDATNYNDKTGTAANAYKVVKAGASQAEVEAEKAVTPSTNYQRATNSASLPNSYTYVDIPIQIPDDVKRVDGATSSYKRKYDSKDKVYFGGSNDASVGDIDGDGNYELIVKWDPSDSKDAANSGYTGRVYIDAYEIDPNNNGPLWRIDLGQNVPAGAHYTQFIVYDFDGDGMSEIAMQTAPGSKDSTGRYVSEVGDTEEIRKVDNTAVYVGTGGRAQNKNLGPDYLTIFDGDGVALRTTAGIPLGDPNAQESVWGDSNNRAFRYLAGVAYLDGIHPSFIISRGYYNKSVIRAYSWDGNDFSMLWEHDSGSKADPNTMYGQGNHNLSIADIDNDGKDEIVWGSACLDDDGSTVLGNTRLGHGDALHVSDFNNDGIQEAFSVKEKEAGFAEGMQFRVAETGKSIWGKAVTDDNGRGIMANIDDEYAVKNPDSGLAIGWSAGFADAYDLKGNSVGARPSKAGRGDFYNFLIYWDGDLGRELIDADILQKHSVTKGTGRFYSANDSYMLAGTTTNNGTKRNYSLIADIWGDWREEIIVPVMDSATLVDTALRIYTSTIPSDYRLTTLMHDCQYRMAIAWQNVGYNQPPHQSYYIGSVALATDENGNKLNYLAPAVPFTKMTYDSPEVIPVTGVTILPESVEVEKGKNVAVKAKIEPDDASKKAVTWTSSNDSVATVKSGVITGVSEGKATITATTVDGNKTAACEVTVYKKHATGIKLSKTSVALGNGMSEQISAYVEPEDATDKTVIWTSADESIATVSQNGTITAVTDGIKRTVITAATENGEVKAECVVKVIPISEINETGDNVFVLTNTDAQTTMISDEAGMSLSQTDASQGAEVYKTFASYTDNKATIAFKFNTGGQRVDGNSSGNINWTGHEYTYYLEFLDGNDNNILTLSQAHTASAQDTMSRVFDGDAVNAGDDWTLSANSDGDNPFGKDTAAWNVEAEFDYDNDKAHVTITGGNSSAAVYEKTFILNGASFAKLRYRTTKDKDNALISVKPSIAGLSYTRTLALVPKGHVMVSGIEGNKAAISYALEDWYDSVSIIGALYDNGRLVEVKSVSAENPKEYAELETSLEFSSNVSDYDIVLFIWDSLEGIKPIVRKSELEKGGAIPTPVPIPTIPPTPTPAPPIRTDDDYEEVFVSKENFLMEDNSANKWIRSSDSNDDNYLSETTENVGGNATAKMLLGNKAVQYVLDEAITSGAFKLTYDMYIANKTSNQGRHFRTYLDNAAHPYDRTTGMASEFNTNNAFFHMTELQNQVYVTADEAYLAANNSNLDSLVPPLGKQLSETEIEGDTWYRVIIEGSLDADGVVNIRYYKHNGYEEDLDVSAAEPVISARGYYTIGRERAIKQIKFMRTHAGSIYYDNIKLEKAD